MAAGLVSQALLIFLRFDTTVSYYPTFVSHNHNQSIILIYPNHPKPTCPVCQPARETQNRTLRPATSTLADASTSRPPEIWTCPGNLTVISIEA